MEQSYEIMECGTKAKTLNPLGELEPDFCAYSEGGEECSQDDTHCDCCKQIDKWNEAESQRVTYEIEFIAPEFDVFCQMIKDGKIDVVKGDVSMQGVNVTYKYTPGTIVKAEIINGKLRIL